MKFRSALAVLSLSLATAVFAADMPKPDPALRQLDIFKGTWQCKGWMKFDGPVIHYTGSETGTWVLDGFWLDVRIAQVKSKENPNPFNGRSYMGYDPASKKFTMGWVDNTGGYETAEFNGWQGDKLVFEGVAHMGMMTAKGRDTFVKSGGDKKLTHSYQMEQGGKWVEVMNETCTR